MRLFCLKGCSREAALGSGTICDGTRGSRITITIADRHGAQIQSIYVIHVFHRQLRGAASGRADGLSGSVRKSGAAHRERLIGDLRARCVVTKDVVLVAAVADTGNSYLASRRRITRTVTRPEIAQTIAPNASANGVPNQCASDPASRLPSGIIAPKTSDHTPMTRPRISSGTIVCSTVFEVEKNRSMPNPATKRNASAT